MVRQNGQKWGKYRRSAHFCLPIVLWGSVFPQCVVILWRGTLDIMAEMGRADWAYRGAGHVVSLSGRILSDLSALLFSRIDRAGLSRLRLDSQRSSFAPWTIRGCVSI